MSVSTAVHWYKEPLGPAMFGGINLSTDVLKVALVRGYTVDLYGHVNYADIAPYEIDFGGSVTGYTTGGQALTTLDWVWDGSLHVWKLTADVVLWSGLDYSAGIDDYIVYNETADILFLQLHPATPQAGSGDFEIDPYIGIYAVGGAL